VDIQLGSEVRLRDGTTGIVRRIAEHHGARFYSLQLTLAARWGTVTTGRFTFAAESEISAIKQTAVAAEETTAA